jgi:hypothetical protein
VKGERGEMERLGVEASSSVGEKAGPMKLLRTR